MTRIRFINSVSWTRHARVRERRATRLTVLRALDPRLQPIAAGPFLADALREIMLQVFEHDRPLANRGRHEHRRLLIRRVRLVRELLTPFANQDHLVIYERRPAGGATDT